MEPRLTEEQRQALRDANDAGPISVVDPKTHVNYILVRADLYGSGHPPQKTDFDPREAYPLVEKVMAEDDSSDPLLGSYQSIMSDHLVI